MSKTTKIILGVLIVFVIVLPLFISSYTTQVLITTITYAMLGLGFAFSMKVGLPRMDVAAWWGIGAYTTAIMMKAGFSFWLTVPIGGIISVLLGLLIFSVVIPRGMLAFFVFCMVLSIAFYQIFGTVGFFGGWSGIVNVPHPTIGSFTFASQESLYYLGLVFLAITIVIYYLLYHSRMGRAFNSIGSGLKLASALGVDVIKYRIINVLVGNFLIAVVGSYFVAYYQAAVPSVFSFTAGLNVMVYLIIGGMAYNLTAPILGALIATFIPEYLKVDAQYQTIFTSGVVVLILMFLPYGVIGVIDQKLKPRIVSWFSRNKSLPQTSKVE